MHRPSFRAIVAQVSRTFLTRRHLGQAALAALTALRPLAASAEEPPDRWVHEGACPFECCSYNDGWRTSGAVPLRDAIDGEVVEILAPGSRVEGITGVVTVVPGTARATRRYELFGGADPSCFGTPEGCAWDAVVTVEPGATVHTLDYIGEGFGYIWYEGKIYQGEAWFLYSEACRDGGKGCWADPLVTPRQSWWARVRTASGREGWIDMVRADFIEGVDGCG